MIIDKVRQIRCRLREAAERAGRRPDAVSLVAVVKYAPLEAVRELLASGEVEQIAENRIQDAQRHKLALGPLADKARWRFIGHLQTNKAKQAVELFDSVDSIDSLHAAQALDGRLEKSLPVLVQVKLAQKETQSGVLPEALPELLEQLRKLPRLDVNGLMGIAPELEPVEAVRPYFKTMRELFDRHFAGRPGAQLSMGMSRDFEIAVEEGATMVRIGTSLFS